MQKDDSERAIRHMCTLWAREMELDTRAADFHPTYSEFKSWAAGKGYSHYWDFRATGGPDYIAEMWFDQEFKQTWRN